MSEAEKVRKSAESPRTAEASVLPTVNVFPEKKELAKPSLHPAFYVMFGATPPRLLR
jgi:hypothetical protein